MKYRKDITDYIIKNKGVYCEGLVFRVFEKEGVLYMGEFEDKEDVSHYVGYHLLWQREDVVLRNSIENLFSVKFPDAAEKIVCKCGESDSFSAFFGDYELLLKCNKCENTFSAYSG